MALKIIIPARLESTRLPGKALLPLNGIPIIQHVFERTCIAAGGSEDVYVATDSEEIAALFHPSHVIMTGKEHRSGTSRLTEAAEELELEEHEYVMNVQGDDPLIDIESLRKFIIYMRKNADLAEAVYEARGKDNGGGLATGNEGFCLEPMGFSTYVKGNDEDLVNPSKCKCVLREEDNYSRWLVYASRHPLARNEDELCWVNNGTFAFNIPALDWFDPFYDDDANPVEAVENIEILRLIMENVPVQAHYWGEVQSQCVDTQEDLDDVRRAYFFFSSQYNEEDRYIFAKNAK